MILLSDRLPQPDGPTPRLFTADLAR